MNQKPLSVYLAAYFAMLIPLPGRFVFGLTMMCELLLLTLIGTLANSLINKLKFEQIKSFLFMLIFISFSILFRQILVIMYTEIALTLGYYIFLPAVCLLVLYSMFNTSNDVLSVCIQNNLQKTLFFCMIGLFFSLIRDFFGYGTITFFGKNHQIYEKVLLNPQKIGVFSFVASIAGAAVLSGIFLFVQIVVKNKMRILINAEVNNVVR